MCGRYDLTDFEWPIIEPLLLNSVLQSLSGAGLFFRVVP